MQGVHTIYSKWARQAAEQFVKDGLVLDFPTYLPLNLTRQRACYITILENPGRKVRAMYGQILPQQPTLAQEIVMNTIAALQQNPTRPIRRADLRSLHYNVALIGTLQRISDMQHLDPQQLGLYVRSDQRKTAVLLPQRTGIDNANDQLATALREAGIQPHIESYTMYRFEVEYDDG